VVQLRWFGVGAWMIVFFLILVLIVILNLKKSDNVENDYMSVRMTNSIKGIFLCMVFFSHIWTYTDFSHPYLDGLYQQLVKRRMGQCVVTMFLFYSGFGIMESIKKRGQAYVERMPVQRFLKVLLLFDSAIIFFWIYRVITGAHYSIKKMLLTFIGWDGIGNSNWYIFCVLWLYIFTYISFVVFKKNYCKAVLGIFLCSIIYMLVMNRAGKDYWWYDTILCYTWGALFSLYRKKAEAFINENIGSWIFFLIVFLIGHIMSYYYRDTNPVVYQLWVFCFVAVIIIFTMRYVVDSRILRWGGVNLFELYILQRLPMMILKPYMLNGEVTIWSKYLYVVMSFAITLILAVIYRKTVGALITKTIKK